jgi:hypothetical protein
VPKVNREATQQSLAGVYFDGLGHWYIPSAKCKQILYKPGIGCFHHGYFWFYEVQRRVSITGAQKRALFRQRRST